MAGLGAPETASPPVTPKVVGGVFGSKLRPKRTATVAEGEAREVITAAMRENFDRYVGFDAKKFGG